MGMELHVVGSSTRCMARALPLAITNPHLRQNEENNEKAAKDSLRPIQDD
jgi:hypothetical protein